MVDNRPGGRLWRVGWVESNEDRSGGAKETDPSPPIEPGLESRWHGEASGQPFPDQNAVLIEESGIGRSSSVSCLDALSMGMYLFSGGFALSYAVEEFCALGFGWDGESATRHATKQARWRDRTRPMGPQLQPRPVYVRVESTVDRTDPSLSRKNEADRRKTASKRTEQTARKSVNRRTVDYMGGVVNLLQQRLWLRAQRDVRTVMPIRADAMELLPPEGFLHQPASNFTTKFVHVSTNKMRCAVNVVRWTPDGHRLQTGSQTGEFTLWNGMCFNFETILQAHETAVRAMSWSHNANWLVSGDDKGTIKYWQTSLNNVKIKEKAHKEALRGLSFAPSDLKFASGSDDVTVKIWDFARCYTELVLTEHGGDVKCLEWHPHKALLASGSKDSLVKLWDVKSGKSVATLQGHKNTVTATRWNKSGRLLLTASRDQLLRVFDIRMNKELRSFKGHEKDITAAIWHPFHEDLFTSASYDGTIIFWLLDLETPQAEIESAHESAVWTMDWHPLGHILCTGSTDNTTKFWCRPRPGDTWKDRNKLAKQDMGPSTIEEAREMGGLSRRPEREHIPGIGRGGKTAFRHGGFEFERNNTREEGQRYGSDRRSGHGEQRDRSGRGYSGQPGQQTMNNRVANEDERTLPGPPGPPPMHDMRGGQQMHMQPPGPPMHPVPQHGNTIPGNPHTHPMPPPSGVPPNNKRPRN